MDPDELYLNPSNQERIMNDPLIYVDKSCLNSESLANTKKDKIIKEAESSKQSSAYSDSSNSKPDPDDQGRFEVKVGPRIKVILTAMKYLVVVAFSAYFMLNFLVCLVYSGSQLKIDLPIYKLPPPNSYMAKHLDLHQKLFQVGPVYTVAFFGPINYTGGILTSIMRDIEAFPGVSELVFNWYDEVLHYEGNYETKKEALVKTIESFPFNPKYMETAFLVENASSLMASSENANELVARSRIFFQLNGFEANISEAMMLDDISDMLEDKYHIKKDQFFLFSPVDGYYETIREIFPSIASLFTLTFETIFFVSIFFVFDLKVILVQSLVVISLITSIMSNLLMFGITLNFFVLMQLSLIPSLVFQFVFSPAYLLVYKSAKNSRQCKYTKKLNMLGNSFKASGSFSSTSELSIEIDNNKHFSIRAESKKPFINKTMKNEIIHSSFFLVAISFFAFSFMVFCDTYNFNLLFLTLMATCLNTSLHLFLFYPHLLRLVGTCY